MNKSIDFLNRLDRINNMIDSEAMKKSRFSLLDYISVTIAGAKYQEEKIKKYFEFACPEKGIFASIGTHENVVLKEAVFLNGLNSHALDYDDGTNSGIIHLGSPIFSLLLPLGQKYNVTIDKLLMSAIIGYEASYTMAISIQPVHKSLGYHATGTCGTLGSAISAAYMLSFLPDERFNAFATACVSASGVLKVFDDGSELKPYNVAKSALLALTSIQMAKAGFKGHPDPLSGDRGFLKMMTGSENTKIQDVHVGDSFAIEKTYTKPYASCRYTHPSIEAAIKLKNKHSINTVDIDSITVTTYSLAVSGHDHTSIDGSYSAKMSIPYSVAVGIIYGKAGLQEFSDHIVGNNDVIRLAKKVKVYSDKIISDSFPLTQTAIVTIKLITGTEYTERVDYPKGEPENPLSDEEFKTRFDDLLMYSGYDKSNADKIYNYILNGGNSVRELLTILR